MLLDGNDDDTVSETRRMNADFIESANSNCRRRLMMTIKTNLRVYDECAYMICCVLFCVSVEVTLVKMDILSLSVSVFRHYFKSLAAFL